MQKYLINKIVDDIVSFIHEQQHHITHVMRNKVGSQLIGLHKNKQYLCEVISLEPLRAKIINELISNIENDFILNVFQASIKPAHLDLAITKACELNANNFYIFNARFSQKDIIHNIARYEKLIINACQQCGRTNPMQISMLTSLQEIIEKLQDNDINLVADFCEHKTDLKQLIERKHKIGIVIGPEGGWTDKDFDYLKNEKNHIINLTKTILRAETATIYLLSVISHIKLGE